jgi:hypothetical protein
VAGEEAGLTKIKKPWKIEFDKSLEPDVQKKLRKVLKPDLSVAQRPGKCIFCEYETTWTIGRQYVCPKCTGKFGFINPDYLPGPCEVCGGQGEWVAGRNDEHALCWRHRDEWFEFTKQPRLFPDQKKVGQAEWDKAWEAVWARFIKEAQSETRES